MDSGLQELLGEWQKQHVVTKMTHGCFLSALEFILDNEFSLIPFDKKRSAERFEDLEEILLTILPNEKEYQFIEKSPVWRDIAICRWLNGKDWQEQIIKAAEFHFEQYTTRDIDATKTNFAPDTWIYRASGKISLLEEYIKTRGWILKNTASDILLRTALSDNDEEFKKLCSTYKEKIFKNKTQQDRAIGWLWMGHFFEDKGKPDRNLIYELSQKYIKGN
jgi:hypothetical protein